VRPMDSADVDYGSAASGEPIRCELVPLPQSYSGTVWTKAPPEPPALALDMGIDGAIRVIDTKTNALVASASLAQVTATPARCRTGGGEYPSHTDPLLIVAVAGLQPLRIRPSPMKYGMTYTLGDYRYSRRDIEGGADRLASADQPTYVVTEADWLALVERFGLSSRVVDDYASGELERRVQARWVGLLVGFVLIFLVFGIALYMHFGR
jgi:hypothetical protein